MSIAGLNVNRGMLLRFLLVLVYCRFSLRTNDAIGGKGDLVRLDSNVEPKYREFTKMRPALYV